VDGAGQIAENVVVHRGNLWKDDTRLGTAQATFIENCVLMGWFGPRPRARRS